MALAQLQQHLAPHGLHIRGIIALDDTDKMPPLPRGGAALSLVLVGNVGGSLWQPFQDWLAAEGEGMANPLDSWSQAVLDPIAADLGGVALYPFGGPPYHPFQQWAMRAGGLQQSPIGPLIDPVYGLWHAFRGALVLPQALIPQPIATGQSPCLSCQDKPCLTTCPVSAIATGAYNVPSCVAEVRGPDRGHCQTQGCQARRACPIGQAHAYTAPQATFHMAAFLRAQ